MIDETPEQPTDETPEEGAPAEGSEPTTAPDEPVAESTDGPAEDVPAEQDDITPEPAPEPQQPDQAEGDDAPAETGETEQPAEEAPAADAPAEDAPAEEAPAADTPAEDAPAEQPRDRRPEPAAAAPSEPEVIPGAHLEPDLVLEQPAAAEGDEYSQYTDGDEAEGEGTDAPTADAPAVRSPLELAADARYQSTGKRKTAIARVILKPGSGNYTINGKALDVYFPRPRLQAQARGPLEATGNEKRMDVAARIHGGGVAAQATALRHGIARALVEAEPSLRTELKRRGYLTRDPREVERKKAGLKKARKRPQFSKR